MLYNYWFDKIFHVLLAIGTGIFIGEYIKRIRTKDNKKD